jgi:hypothetical protein
MISNNELWVLVEDEYGDLIWERRTNVNLGSYNNPNQEIKSVKFIVRK